MKIFERHGPNCVPPSRPSLPQHCPGKAGGAIILVGKMSLSSKTL